MALTAVVGFVLTVGMASHGNAQQPTRSVGQQLVGTWLFVSEVATRPDGTRYEPFGGNTKGILMLDSTGHFSQQLMGDARRKFASNNRLEGTPEENKSIPAGTLAYCGTYSVDAAGRTLTFHVERSSLPNWDGTDQKRTIALAGDELKWSSPAASGGGMADLVWHRAK
jgi:hypothetical protein